MNRRVLAAVLAAAALAAGGFWAYKAKLDKAEAPRGRVVEATTGLIEETVEANGSVTPLNRVEVRPPIGGRVDELLVDEGSAVKAGQLLAWMSSNDRAAILDAARAKGPEELKRWQDAYKPTPIVSPLAGTVILRNVVVGQTVEASTVLYAVADTLIVLAQVDESEIGRVRVGMPARIVLDAYPAEKVPGRVTDILHEGKNVSNVITYGVKVRPDKVPGFFRSQMTANVSFILGRRPDAVLVPAAAVSEGRGGMKQVLIPGPDNTPTPREVETGIESGESIEIVKGLAAGDKVLLMRGRYRPQQAPQASPLGMPGGRPGQGQGQQGQRPGSRPRNN